MPLGLTPRQSGPTASPPTTGQTVAPPASSASETTIRLLAATFAITGGTLILAPALAHRIGLGDAAFGPFEQMAVVGGIAVAGFGTIPWVPMFGRWLTGGTARRSGRLWRSVLVSIALLSIVPLGFAAWHPDLRLEPGTMLKLVTLPAIAAALSLALAVLPRTARINLVVLVGLIALGEIGFAIAKLAGSTPGAEARAATARKAEERSGTYYHGYFLFDHVLGYRPRPGTRVTSLLKRGDTVVYDVVYTIGESGWRRTPATGAEAAKSRFVAFFGDSFTVGEGVNDDETLPFFVESLAPGYRSYNFGFHGWGPQHMLAILESLEVRKEVAQDRGIAVFTFIDGHLARLVGTMRIHNAWGHHLPYYRLDAGGEVVRAGNFTSGRPLEAFLYPLLGWSATIRFFGYDPRSRETEEQYALAAAVLARSCDLFARAFRSDGCHVLIYPGSANASRRLSPLLRERGIATLDYANLYEGEDASRFKLGGDGHPSAAGHRTVAARIVKDLGLDR